jgi:hypothetical protein
VLVPFAGRGGSSPPSDTDLIHTVTHRVDLHVNRLVVW